MENITIQVINGNDKADVEAPVGVGLSLMEVLKGYGYPIEATCGGMALCATCHVEIMSDTPLREASEDEWLILGSLPNFTDRSRLSCQINIEESLDGLSVKLMEHSLD